jgi:Ca2+-binding EF-hand superfamily protein
VQFEEFLNASLVKEKNRLLKLFQRLDQDQDGAIEFVEFVAAREPNFEISIRGFHWGESAPLGLVQGLDTDSPS